MNAAKFTGPPYFASREREGRTAYYFHVPPGRRPAAWPEHAEPWPLGVTRQKSPRLSDDLTTALGQAQALYRALQNLRSSKAAPSAEPPPGSIPWLIREFQEGDLYAEKVSAWSDSHRRNTQQNWNWWLGISARLAAAKRRMSPDAVEARHHLPVNEPGAEWTAKAIARALSMPEIKSKITMRRSLRASLSLLMGVAVMEGLLDSNPCSTVRLPTPKSTFHEYTDDQIALLIENAPRLIEHGDAMARLIALMAEIGQREGDCLRLQYGRDYRGGEFAFQISKTRQQLVVPATAYLRDIIGDGAGSIGPIVHWPYSADHLRHQFRSVCRSLGIPDEAQIMHCRHYAVSRLVREGFTAEQIRAITRWSLATVHQMMERYSAPSTAVARAVVARIDEVRKERG